MNYDIVHGIAIVVLYIFTLYAGYKKVEDKLNKNESYAAIWENLERVGLATFCIVFSMYLLSMKFDLMAYFLKEILGELGVLTAHG